MPREKDLNLQPPGSEPGVLPIELSLKKGSLPRALTRTGLTVAGKENRPAPAPRSHARRQFPLGERLDSNQQPEAYEAPALPLSYAPMAGS